MTTKPGYLNNVANAYPIAGGQALGCLPAPRGPADDVVDAINALGVAIEKARKAGWFVDLEFAEGELSVALGKRAVIRPEQRS